MIASFCSCCCFCLICVQVYTLSAILTYEVVFSPMRTGVIVMNGNGSFAIHDVDLMIMVWSLLLIKLTHLSFDLCPCPRPQGDRIGCSVLPYPQDATSVIAVSVGCGSTKSRNDSGYLVVLYDGLLSLRIVGTFALLHASEGCAAIRAAIDLSCHLHLILAA